MRATLKAAELEVNKCGYSTWNIRSKLKVSKESEFGYNYRDNRRVSYIL